MLAPKISLRQLLWSMAGIAIFLAMVSTAWRGNLVTFGQSLAIGLLPLLFLIYAITYWILFGIASWIDWRLRSRQNFTYAESNSAETINAPEPRK